MVGTIDARALGERAGHLSREELRAVVDALPLVLDMASSASRSIALAAVA